MVGYCTRTAYLKPCLNLVVKGGKVKDSETYHPTIKACAAEVADELVGEVSGDLKEVLSAIERLTEEIANDRKTKE